ncbi:DUF2271 domain-containing protein [Aquabacterium sp. OR-4]|uniref:DUF2271 domain-containing protein n=1 Tax=Aquabacterium sp. OR-4 TaxID=2978127 RepID=UPI0021B4AD9C|nr:DUF2271 domain-containing protein [Aquabacterium sp. OR-4]MDT7836655.1 DUF2271 domain-containing protein [Aquabacterium sp. OR-4]
MTQQPAQPARPQHGASSSIGAPGARHPLSALGALGIFGSLAVGSPAWAASLQLQLELPRLNVAEYHRPYVAVWVEKPGQAGAMAQLAVWYDLKKANNGGTKWLRDMRQWWRQGGRDLSVPADGVSGATRAPGEHSLQLAQHAQLAKLPAGQYELVIEAAREGGGREVQRLPFSWPLRAAQSASAQGEHELGALRLNAQP